MAAPAALEGFFRPGHAVHSRSRQWGILEDCTIQGQLLLPFGNVAMENPVQVGGSMGKSRNYLVDFPATHFLFLEGTCDLHTFFLKSFAYIDPTDVM